MMTKTFEITYTNGRTEQVHAETRAGAKYAAFDGDCFPDGFKSFLPIIKSVRKISDERLPTEQEIYIAKEKAMCDEWNAKNPTGTSVDLTLDDGKVVRTWTVGPAHQLGSGTAVIYVKGYGNYDFERIRSR